MSGSPKPDAAMARAILDAVMPMRAAGMSYQSIACVLLLEDARQVMVELNQDFKDRWPSLRAFVTDEPERFFDLADEAPNAFEWCAAIQRAAR